MDAKTILLSLSLDLKRITEAIQKKSTAADVFNREASSWLNQAMKLNDDKLEVLLEKISITLKSENSAEKAEDCLMYSVLIQNRALQMTK